MTGSYALNSAESLHARIFRVRYNSCNSSLGPDDDALAELVAIQRIARGLVETATRGEFYLYMNITKKRFAVGLFYESYPGKKLQWAIMKITQNYENMVTGRLNQRVDSHLMLHIKGYCYRILVTTCKYKIYSLFTTT